MLVFWSFFCFGHPLLVKNTSIKTDDLHQPMKASKRKWRKVKLLRMGTFGSVCFFFYIMCCWHSLWAKKNSVKMTALGHRQRPTLKVKRSNFVQNWCFRGCFLTLWSVDTLWVKKVNSFHRLVCQRKRKCKGWEGGKCLCQLLNDVNVIKFLKCAYPISLLFWNWNQINLI